MKPEVLNPGDYNSDCSNDLKKRCRRGDPSAQLQVYKLFYKPVFGICMQIVNDRNVAEEIMQESFLLAFENMDSYIDDISISSWINRFIKFALQRKQIC